MTFTNKDAKLRFYDGTATPFYFELCLDNGDVSAPIGIMKHEEILVLDRGLVDSCTHYITGNDAGIMEPLTVSFSAMINDAARFLIFLDMLEVANGGSVNGNTVVTTKGTHDRITTGSPDLSFFDTTKMCWDLEYRMAGTTNSIVYHLNECYFSLNDQTFSEAEDAITLSLTGNCYGTITRTAGAFTAGTDITA